MGCKMNDSSVFFTITEIGAAEPKKEVETNASSVSALLLPFQTRCRFDIWI